MLEILVVDDHPLVRAGLQCVLDVTDDLRVVGTAGDGAQAVRLTAELSPDVVMMDLRMPGMDGVQVTRLLRALDPAPAVVVLTSSCDPVLVRASFDAGASGYLLKDMPPDQLVTALRRLESGHRPIDRRAARILARGDGRALSAGAVPSADACALRRFWHVLRHAPPARR